METVQLLPVMDWEQRVSSVQMIVPLPHLGKGLCPCVTTVLLANWLICVASYAC